VLKRTTLSPRACRNGTFPPYLKSDAARSPAGPSRAKLPILSLLVKIELEAGRVAAGDNEKGVRSVEKRFLPTTGTRRGAGANARQACAEASKIKVVSKNLAMVMSTVQAVYNEKASRGMRTTVIMHVHVMGRREYIAIVAFKECLSKNENAQCVYVKSVWRKQAL
jgi:hypothetical protein